MTQRVVLVVEDATECLAPLDVALESIAGLCIQYAATAEEALRTLERQHISALITDYHLPEMDGLELVSSIRKRERNGRLPILVVSGDSDPETPKRALLNGADAFFSKPYSPAAVRRKLEEILNAS
jgi:CheY-like chemotaxis protein